MDPLVIVAIIAGCVSLGGALLASGLAFTGAWFDTGDGMAAIDSNGNLVAKNGTGATRGRIAATIPYFVS